MFFIFGLVMGTGIGYVVREYLSLSAADKPRVGGGPALRDANGLTPMPQATIALRLRRERALSLGGAQSCTSKPAYW